MKICNFCIKVVRLARYEAMKEDNHGVFARHEKTRTDFVWFNFYAFSLGGVNSPKKIWVVPANLGG